MAHPSTPTDLPLPALASDRPLLSALTRWWIATDAAAAEPVLGYESAQPWMLDEAVRAPSAHTAAS